MLRRDGSRFTQAWRDEAWRDEAVFLGIQTLRAELELIYLRHRQGLFSLALSITRCTESAEDAVHDAFVRLCRSASRPAGELVPYVFASVRNSAIDRHQRDHRQQQVIESVFSHAVTVSAGTPDLETAVQKQLLAATIDGLDDQSRQIVVMKIYGELTFAEIAEILQAPMGTVTSRFRRAIQSVEESLRNCHDRS